jgi:propionyl-CoA synthetase
MGSCCSCCSKEEAKDPYIRYDKPETNDFTNEKYDEEFKKSIDKREEFWAEQAKKISWEKEPTVILEGGGPDTTAKWFTDGELNIVYNCLDRHVDAELGDEMMFLYSSPQSKITAKLDYDQVCANTGKIANVFKNHFGLVPGDHVFFYAPTIPMVLCVLLSCARMGAVHDACYGGVSPEQLAARLDVSKPKLIMVVSGAFEAVPDDEKTEERPFDIVKYVPNLEKALDLCKNVDRSVPKLIYQRRELGGALFDDTVDPAVYTDYKDVCEDDELDEDDCDFLPSTHPLYVAYTSGASGLPVGIVRDHGSTAVALQYAMEHVFGMTRESVQFAACHQAWSIGLDFMVYGPLLIGCKTVIWEGDPLYPDPFILWTIIESNGVTNMIVNISTLREIRKEDYEGLGLEESDLSCLKSIALVGERSDPEIIEWLHEHLPEVIINDTYFISELCWPISGQLCQLDTYETVFPTLKGSVTRSIPGFDVKVLTDDGVEME